MTAEFIESYAWVFWVGLILIFIIVEMLTVDFTFLMVAVGSVGGLLGSLVHLPWWVQVLIAAILAVLLIFTVRPPLLRALKRGGDPARSNTDALLGLTGTVIADFTGTLGHIKLANGETWTARLAGAPVGTTRTHFLTAGDSVVVTAIDGATAIVVPTERIHA